MEVKHDTFYYLCLEYDVGSFQRPRIVSFTVVILFVEELEFSLDATIR